MGYQNLAEISGSPRNPYLFVPLPINAPGSTNLILSELRSFGMETFFFTRIHAQRLGRGMKTPLMEN